MRPLPRRTVICSHTRGNNMENNDLKNKKDNEDGSTDTGIASDQDTLTMGLPPALPAPPKMARPNGKKRRKKNKTKNQAIAKPNDQDTSPRLGEVEDLLPEPSEPEPSCCHTETTATVKKKKKKKNKRKKKLQTDNVASTSRGDNVASASGTENAGSKNKEPRDQETSRQRNVPDAPHNVLARLVHREGRSPQIILNRERMEGLERFRLHVRSPHIFREVPSPGPEEVQRTLEHIRRAGLGLDKEEDTKKCEPAPEPQPLQHVLIEAANRPAPNINAAEDRNRDHNDLVNRALAVPVGWPGLGNMGPNFREMWHASLRLNTRLAPYANTPIRPYLIPNPIMGSAADEWVRNNVPNEDEDMDGNPLGGPSNVEAEKSRTPALDFMRRVATNIKGQQEEQPDSTQASQADPEPYSPDSQLPGDPAPGTSHDTSPDLPHDEIIEKNQPIHPSLHYYSALTPLRIRRNPLRISRIQTGATSARRNRFYFDNSKDHNATQIGICRDPDCPRSNRPGDETNNSAPWDPTQSAACSSSLDPAWDSPRYPKRNRHCPATFDASQSATRQNPRHDVPHTVTSSTLHSETEDSPNQELPSASEDPTKKRKRNGNKKRKGKKAKGSSAKEPAVESTSDDMEFLLPDDPEQELAPLVALVPNGQWEKWAKLVQKGIMGQHGTKKKKKKKRKKNETWSKKLSELRMALDKSKRMYVKARFFWAIGEMRRQGYNPTKRRHPLPKLFPVSKPPGSIAG